MKKFLTIVCLAAFLIAGIFAAVEMAQLPRTYDGANAKVSPYELMQDPEAYDDSEADGAAAVKIAVIAALVIAVNPIGAHAIAKGAYRSGVRPERKMEMDDFRRDFDE